MTFDSTDLSDYDLTVKKTSMASFMPGIETNHIEVADEAYDFRAYLRPRTITLEVYVTGTSKANLISNLDNISKLFNPIEGVKNLVLDFPDDRYFKAKLSDKAEWEIVTHELAQGTLTFICPDPLGYASSETSSDHTIDADPKTVTETPGGSAYINPVYTLTAGEDLTDVTIKLENPDTDEELQWIGSLSNGEELEVDVGLWIVKKEGTADMADVSGQFPRLMPGIDNSIKVTGLSTTGSLNITYRDTYL